MSATRREVSAAELDVIVRLSALYSDLHQVEVELKELGDLRKQVAELRRIAVGGDAVQPRSVG